MVLLLKLTGETPNAALRRSHAASGQLSGPPNDAAAAVTPNAGPRSATVRAKSAPSASHPTTSTAIARSPQHTAAEAQGRALDRAIAASDLSACIPRDRILYRLEFGDRLGVAPSLAGVPTDARQIVVRPRRGDSDHDRPVAGLSLTTLARRLALARLTTKCQALASGATKSAPKRS